MSTHVLLWSKSQNCFHVEPVAELVRKNGAAFMRDATLNDYHPLAFGTQADMLRNAANLRSTLHERDAGREAL